MFEPQRNNKKKIIPKALERKQSMNLIKSKEYYLQRNFKLLITTSQETDNKSSHSCDVRKFILMVSFELINRTLNKQY